MTRYQTISSVGLTALVLALMGAVMTGCQPTQTVRSSDTDAELANKTTVVTSRYEPTQETVVRVYSLRGVGLKDAPPEEIQAFTDTIYKMVVTNNWERTNSSIQVFGILATVRTTPENHLLIEAYLDRVRRIVSES